MNAFIHTLQKNVEVLTQPSAVEEFKYIPQEEKTLPNIDQLKEIVYLIRSILFPGYFGVTGRSHNSQQYYVGVNIEKLYSLLDEQIYNGLHFFMQTGKERRRQILRNWRLSLLTGCRRSSGSSVRISKLYLTGIPLPVVMVR